MAAAQEIPGSHVPLAFLLGSQPRRVSSLPPRNWLPQLSAQRSTSSECLLDRPATLRQREALSRSLLQELEHRSPTNRHQRQQEIRALLQDFDKNDDAPEPPLLQRRSSSATTDDVDVYALPEYHGYAVTDPGFLSVAGDAAPVARASSLEELHRQEVTRQRREHRARRRTVETAVAQLRAQQAATQATLRELAKRGLPKGERLNQEVNSTPVHQWKERQRKELEQARAREAEDQAQRRRRVEALKAQEHHGAHSQRRAARRPGAGPSYSSTLRTEENASSTAIANDVLLLDLAREEEEAERLPPNRLRARQHELFVQSLASVQLGGGFNVHVQDRPRSGRDESSSEHELVAAAVAVPVVQTKRQVLSHWKATLRRAKG
ncbi:hypothetical protein ATCC90586_000580 [Pythium insidiosum]|nr:hypothetical protein ATCC90586_000580 [Pythium insidiosum]